MMLNIRRAFACAMVMAASLSWAPATHAQSAQAPPEIVTSGYGSITLPADRAVVRVGIATRSPTASEASAANGPLVTRVQDTLRVLGLVDRNARVVSFGVAPVYEYQNGPPRLSGYEARTTMEISLRDVPALGRTLDAVLAVGATEINSISFQSDTAAAAKRHALKAAVTTAKDEAQALAAAAGGKLGALKALSTTPEGQAAMFSGTAYNEMASEPFSQARGRVPAVQRDVVVSARVFARWVFVPTP